MIALKLSICIATYNRESYIGETLDCLIEQVSDDIEIVVLDGASKDNTAVLVRKYEETCPQLRYVRLNENGGVDRDFDRAVEHARGEYCWLMTDDDLLRPDAVSVVLETLKSDYSLVVVNAEVRNADFSRVLEERRLPITSPRTYLPNELDGLFAENGAYLTFIGCVVIKRAIWMARKREMYYGSLFIHVGVIFQQPLPSDTFVIADTLISIRYGNAMWRPKEFEIWMFKWPSLVWSFPALSEPAKKAVCSAEPWRELKRLFFYRAKGTYSAVEYRQWIQPRTDSAWLRFAAWGIAVVPGSLANWIALIYFRFVDRDQGMAVADTKCSRFYFRNWFKSRRPA